MRSTARSGARDAVGGAQAGLGGGRGIHLVQATYNGYPLYTFDSDNAPGQAHGNGAGGAWHVIPEKAPGSSAPGSSAAGGSW